MIEINLSALVALIVKAGEIKLVYRLNGQTLRATFKAQPGRTDMATVKTAGMIYTIADQGYRAEDGDQALAAALTALARRLPIEQRAPLASALKHAND